MMLIPLKATALGTMMTKTLLLMTTLMDTMPLLTMLLLPMPEMGPRLAI